MMATFAACFQGEFRGSSDHGQPQAAKVAVERQAGQVVEQRGPGSVIAYVKSTGFLAGEYFKALRTLLAAEAPPVAVDFMRAASPAPGGSGG